MENKGCTEGTFCLRYMMTLMMNTNCFFHHRLSPMLTDYSTEVPQESQHNEACQTDANTDLEGLRKGEGGINVSGTKVTVGTVLTTKQLVVRRGLAVSFMLLLLAGGIVLNEVLIGILR